MPIICYVPQFNTSCPVECFMKLILCLTLVVFLVYLPLVCLSQDRCCKTGKDREFVCHFCDLPNTIINVVGRLFNLLINRGVPSSEETPASAPVPAKVNEKVNEVPKQIPKETPKPIPKEIPKVKEKKKLCSKVSDLFKKCKSKKSKDKTCVPTGNVSKPNMKIGGKSKSEPELGQPDLALNVSCPRCVDKKTPCPNNCPKSKRK